MERKLGGKNRGRGGGWDRWGDTDWVRGKGRRHRPSWRPVQEGLKHLKTQLTHHWSVCLDFKHNAELRKKAGEL